MSTSPYFIPLIVSNLFALVLLIAAVFWPSLVRWAFAALFFAAGLVNGILAVQGPELYVQSYGETAWLGFYRSFINGPFAANAAAVLLAVAAGQLLVAIFLTRRGTLFRLGVLGGCLFLAAIAPLGLGSTFPSALVMLAALLMSAYNLVKMEVV